MTAPQTVPADGSLAVIRFQAGGLRFAVEASSVVKMQADTNGMDTELFSTAMGLAPARSAARILVLRQGDTLRPLVVEEPVVILDVPYQEIHPLPPLVAAGLKQSLIRALIWDRDGLVILVALPDTRESA